MPRPARIAALFAVAAVALASPLAALAQAYPSKPVTIVVPWPPGGPSDIAARPMAKGLGDELKQTFIIDNRGGAGGNIGSAMVAKAAPDGYTLLITSSAPIVINPSLYKQMPFDPPKDLAPITNLLRVPLILAVNPSVPAKNLKELLAYINSQKGKIQYASSGNGTPQHLTGELFKSTAKVDMIHVPYKGSAPAITDLVGGHVPIMFDSAIAILPQIKAGKVKADRHHQRQALGGIAGRADVRRGRHARLRVLCMVRLLRAREDAAGYRHQAQCGGVEVHEVARVAEGARGYRLGERRRGAGAVRRLHQGGGDQVGEGGEGERGDDRLSEARAKRAPKGGVVERWRAADAWSGALHRQSKEAATEQAASRRRGAAAVRDSAN